MPRTPTSLDEINARIVACAKCPRLNAYRAGIGGKAGPYWNRPVPGFGDPKARLLVFGLAPGAHGANRTGRPFTGDAAGIWLYRGLHEIGLSSAEKSEARDDGLVLKDVYISNAVRCVPPANKPTPPEVAACANYLADEMVVLRNLKAVLALGRTAHDALIKWCAGASKVPVRRKDFPFRHQGVHRLPSGLIIVDSYHTSRYNTSTGVLTWEMFETALAAAVRAARSSEPNAGDLRTQR